MLFYRTYCYCFFFFFHDTPTTAIYTLSLHDALPIFQQGIQQVSQELHARSRGQDHLGRKGPREPRQGGPLEARDHPDQARSEEHTSELQSHSDLVCRLLLEKKKQEKIQMKRSPTSRT